MRACEREERRPQYIHMVGGRSGTSSRRLCAFLRIVCLVAGACGALGGVGLDGGPSARPPPPPLGSELGAVSIWRLRVAYASRDFGHSAGRCAHGAAREHSRRRVAVLCYHVLRTACPPSGPGDGNLTTSCGCARADWRALVTDPFLTQRVAAHCDSFDALCGCPDVDVPSAVVADGADIVVDLSGLAARFHGWGGANSTRAPILATGVGGSPGSTSALGTCPVFFGDAGCSDGGSSRGACPYVIMDTRAVPVESRGGGGAAAAVYLPHTLHTRDYEMTIPMCEAEKCRRAARDLIAGLPRGFSGVVFADFSAQLERDIAVLGVWLGILRRVPHSVLVMQVLPCCACFLFVVLFVVLSSRAAQSCWAGPRPLRARACGPVVGRGPAARGGAVARRVSFAHFIRGSLAP